MKLLAANGKLVCAEGGGGPGSVLNARTEPPGNGWEDFVEAPTDDGRVSLRASGGCYVSAQPDGTVQVDRTAVGPWEKWTKVNVGGVVGYRSDHGLYLCADLGMPVSSPDGWTGCRVVANRNVMASWETFQPQGGIQPVPLEELAKIRGAMWTARLDVPWGPRPGQPDNCLCIDYFECFSPSDQDRIIAAYGPASPRRYTHAPMGPIVDPGYHGELPAVDWRSNPDVYLDAAVKLENAGVHVVHFLRPDRGVDGLEWTVADLDRELGPVFASTEAQDVMRIVCLGWEPGPRYYYNNAWWVEMCQWMARTFPNALRLIHMVSDCDAPTGQNDDQLGLTNAQCWANVAPHLHGFLAQYGGYVDLDQNDPQFAQKYAAFKVEFGKAVASYVNRFTNGYGGWPTFSAWGPNKGIQAYAAEYAAFADYWQNAPEAESIELGRIAMDNGAPGFLDGGPPVSRAIAVDGNIG